MLHVSRTHRMNLDWLFVRFNLDSNISFKYDHTKQPIVDILTKGSFTRDKWNELMILLVLFLTLITAAHFYSLPPWLCLLSRSRREAVRLLTKPLNEEVHRHCRKPVGKRVLALSAVRLEKSSPLISAQEQTQSDVYAQESLSQASTDRLHFPGSTRNPEVKESDASDVEAYD